MNEITLLIAGFTCGFLSSSPLGTINFWLIDQTLHHKKNLLPFLTGVIVADLSYAAIAAWGYHSLISDSAIGKWVTAAGGLLLIVLGFFALKTKTRNTPRVTADTQSTPKTIDRLGQIGFQKFFLGLFMCGSNPAFLLFWIFAMGTLETRFTVDFSGLSLGSFLIGIAIGDLTWFATLIALVRKLREKINGDFSTLISRAVACIFIGVGSYGIFHLISA